MGRNAGPDPIPEVTHPLPLLSEKVARRIAEIDRILEIVPGEGVAETVLQNIINDILEGDTGLMDARDWGDREQADAELKALADRWKAEDAAPEQATLQKGGLES